jgi:ribokinase
VGTDAFGDQLVAFLAAAGIDVSHLYRASTPTGTALISVDEQGQNQISIFPGANSLLRLSDDFGNASPGSVLLCQNECALDVVAEYVKAARHRKVITILNAAPAVEVSRSLWEMIDILVVNQDEAGYYYSMLQNGRDPPQDVTDLAKRLKLRRDQVVIVTLGADGVAGVTEDQIIREQAHKVSVADTTGAGDCFCGYLACCLAEGKAIVRAIALANAAAALAVQRHGASVAMPSRSEVELFLSSATK